MKFFGFNLKQFLKINHKNEPERDAATELRPARHRSAGPCVRLPPGVPVALNTVETGRAVKVRRFGRRKLPVLRARVRSAR